MKPVAGRVCNRYCGRIAVDSPEPAYANAVPCRPESRSRPRRTRLAGHRTHRRGAPCTTRRDAARHRCGALQHCRRATSRCVLTGRDARRYGIACAAVPRPYAGRHPSWRAMQRISQRSPPGSLRLARILLNPVYTGNGAGGQSPQVRPAVAGGRSRPGQRRPPVFGTAGCRGRFDRPPPPQATTRYRSPHARGTGIRHDDW